jgi:integrase
MPRPKKGPRLYLRPRSDRSSTWVIRDRAHEISTGCGEGELERAEQALERYIASKYSPPQKVGNQLQDVLVADVMTAYLREHAPHTQSVEFIKHTAAPIIDWWGTKTLADIKGKTCRDYVVWRVKLKVSDQTARHDLKTLRAAINHYHREHGPLPSVPMLTLPARSPPRQRWLTRSEVAAMIRAARHGRLTRHIARLVLIGIYTGTRSKAMLRLKWLPSTDGGWVDLDSGILHRRGQLEQETKKRRTPARIPERLLPHLRRWHALDMARGIVHVVHYYGRPIGKLRRSWDTARDAAELGEDVVPHTLRHTAATWLMQAGCDRFEAAGLLGMSAAMLEEVYGHHHPDYQRRAARAVSRRD